LHHYRVSNCLIIPILSPGWTSLGGALQKKATSPIATDLDLAASEGSMAACANPSILERMPCSQRIGRPQNLQPISKGKFSIHLSTTHLNSAPAIGRWNEKAMAHIPIREPICARGAKEPTKQPSTSETSVIMTKLQFKGSWNEVKGKLKQKYAQLTDDDLTFAEGKDEEFLGRLERRLGRNKQELRDEIERL